MKHFPWLFKQKQKIKETRLIFHIEVQQFHKKWQIIKKRKGKLTNPQLNKLKSAAKNKTRIILRLNKKYFADEELPHELTTRQTTKIRNTFAYVNRYKT